MSATRESSGTQTAVISTEHTLATITSAKSFQAKVDLTNLAAGEFVRLRVNTKTLSAGTTRTLYEAIYSWLDGLVTPVIVTPAICAPGDYVVTLTQLNGTGRNFDWSIDTP